MNRTLTTLLASCSLAFCVNAFAQDSVLSGLSAEELSQLELEEAPIPELPPLEQASFASKTLSYEEGMESLRENNLQVEIARQSLHDAAVIDSQARSIFVPTLNVTGQIVYNSREVTLEMGNMFAPLSPYLESTYQNDPALQAYFANNPEAVDARALANAEPESMVVSPRVDYSAQATLTQPIFTARIFPARKLANIVQAQAEAGIEVAAQQSLVAYNQLYFQAVSLRQFIAVAKQNVENARIQLERAQILFEEEAGSRFDVTRAEVQHRAAQRDLANAQTSYQLSIEALATLMRVEANFDVLMPEELEAPTSLQAVMDIAMSERAEFTVSELDVAWNDAKAQEAKMRKYPTLMAQANASVGRVTVFTDKAVTWSLALIASWDILDGGAANRDRRSARIEQTRASLRRELERDQIRDEIRRSWLEYENQDNLIGQAAAEVALAAENYQLTLDARQLGAASALDVDVAQNQLYHAQLAYSDAITSKMSAIYNLYIMQGTSHAILKDQ